MNSNGHRQRNIAFDAGQGVLTLLDQTVLPFAVKRLSISRFDQACHAIKTMQVRGAPAIGAVAACAMALAVREQRDIAAAAATLKNCRPTAVNLAWAVDRVVNALQQADDAWSAACTEAQQICDEDVAACSAIGDAGLAIIADIAHGKSGPVNILTHCNAGRLATVDWGTALAPVYKAQQAGIDVHVWVDETRPRNQGALLTSYELAEAGVPHTLVCDNAGGHLMQTGRVDLCLVGSDRTAANGDVCNKIGTYLKALAAFDNRIPFYVALPVSTIDWALATGGDIPIEERSEQEVLTVTGCDADGLPASLSIAAAGVSAANPGFDVTPARYVTGLITEYGLVAAEPEALKALGETLCRS